MSKPSGKLSNRVKSEARQIRVMWNSVTENDPLHVRDKIRTIARTFDEGNATLGRTLFRQMFPNFDQESFALFNSWQQRDHTDNSFRDALNRLRCQRPGLVESLIGNTPPSRCDLCTFAQTAPNSYHPYLNSIEQIVKHTSIVSNQNPITISSTSVNQETLPDDPQSPVTLCSLPSISTNSISSQVYSPVIYSDINTPTTPSLLSPLSIISDTSNNPTFSPSLNNDASALLFPSPASTISLGLSFALTPLIDTLTTPIYSDPSFDSTPFLNWYNPFLPSSAEISPPFSLTSSLFLPIDSSSSSENNTYTQM